MQCTYLAYRLSQVLHPIAKSSAKQTCQTNVRCTLELVDELESGTKIRDADNNIQQINNII